MCRCRLRYLLCIWLSFAGVSFGRTGRFAYISLVAGMIIVSGRELLPPPVHQPSVAQFIWLVRQRLPNR